MPCAPLHEPAAATLSAGKLDFRWGDEVNYYGDLTHPKDSGQQKAAGLILNFLLTSPFTQAWIGQ